MRRGEEELGKAWERFRKKGGNKVQQVKNNVGKTDRKK